MADIRCLAEVRLWQRQVGAIVELVDGRVVFEYAEAFRRSGPEISPIHLGLAVEGPVEFPELVRLHGFAGLPGVFADSLPDSFGNAVIRAYYAARGEEARAMSPVQRLLYVGTRAIGALTYHPETDMAARPAEQESLEVAALVRDARRIVEGDPDVAVPEIYRIGSSAGGMRPKAVVLYSRERGTVRAGSLEPRADEARYILKFDGVGDALSRTSLKAPAPFNRVEAAYARMAADAGIEMADVQVMEGAGGYAHLLVRRFDYTPEGERVHQHTLGGLLHVDYNDVGASSYEEFLRACLRLGLPPAAIEEGFRRMVFNVVAVNQDDHVKNLSFHMLPDGTWRLAPAYDITFARGLGYTSQHQMRIADKRADITSADLIAVGRGFGIRAPQRIVERTLEVTARWTDYAREFDVPADSVAHIEKELAQRRRELGHGSSPK